MSTLARTTALALLAACTSDPSPSPGGVPASRDDGAWIYTVRAGEGARVLEVTAEFPGHTARRFAVDPEAAAFVEDAAWWDGAAWLPLARGNDEWTLPSGAGGSPRLRYRFRLEEAARAIDSPSTAAVRMDCLVGPPSAWTLRPTEGSTPRVVLQVETPADVVFATGIFRDPGDPGVDGNTYVIPSWFLPHAPFTAFGPFMSRSLSAGGSEILVVSPPPPYQMPADLPLDWVEEAAAQVADYFDGFPVPRVLVHLHRRSGFASTLGNGGASIDFPLGRRPRVEKFEDDWVMAHEMVHLGFPSVAGRHRWIEEGTASYVEPVARVRTGDISREAFWSELVRNLPRGQPLAERWALIPEDTDVLITHGPPRGYGDRCFDGRREGCDDLLARLDVVRPSLHLFGHIHEDRGHWWRDETLIVNATVAECEAPPTVLDYVDGSWRPA